MAVNREAVRHQRHMELADQPDRRLAFNQPRGEVADGQRLAAQTGLHGDLRPAVADILLRRRERHHQPPLPFFPRRQAQILNGQPAIGQHRLPFRQGARRAGGGFTLREFAQAGAVDIQLIEMQAPAAGVGKLGVGDPCQLAVANHVA